MRILLADDSEPLRKAVARSLRLKGHDVSAVEDADRAILELESAEYDVLITDFDMRTGMTGLELLKFVQSSEKFGALPVVVYTATSDYQTLVERAESGVFIDRHNPGEALLPALQQAVPGRY
jgi:DNA-binding NtrC family response regulator